MKTFRGYISEEVTINALGNGGIDIERDAVRDEINGILASISMHSCVTPYNTLTKVRKALSYFSIFLPKRVYMEGKHGIEVWQISQFGDKMGMTDQGEFIKSTPGKYYLFFHYHLIGSMYSVRAKIVDEVGLNKEMDFAEAMIAEGAAMQQGLAKAVAPKEPMHDEDGDGTESTKKAVEVSMRRKDKKLSADSLDEAHKVVGVKGHESGDRYEMRTHAPGEHHEWSSIVKTHQKGQPTKNEYGGHSPLKVGKTAYIKKHFSKLSEEHLDEAGFEKLIRYKNAANKDLKHQKNSPVGRGDWWKQGDTDDPENRRKEGIKLADKKMKGKARVNASMPKHPYMEETLDELYGKGSLPRIAAYHTKKSAESKEQMEKTRSGNKKLPVPKKVTDKVYAKDSAAKYHAHQAKRAKGMMEEETLEEKLSKKMSAAEVIHDFVHSDDPRFQGKTTKERMKMALGAYYKMHPEKSKMM